VVGGDADAFWQKRQRPIAGQFTDDARLSPGWCG
jgi:hypothetical protein